MSRLLRSSRHLIVLFLCLGLLLFGLWRGISSETIEGANGSGSVWGLHLPPWLLIAWVIAVLGFFFVWRRRG